MTRLLLVLCVAAGCNPALPAPGRTFVGPRDARDGLQAIVEWDSLPPCGPDRSSAEERATLTSTAYVSLVGARIRLPPTFQREQGQPNWGWGTEMWVDAGRADTLRARLTDATKEFGVGWVLTNTWFDSAGRRIRTLCADCAAATSRCRLRLQRHDVALVHVSVTAYQGYLGDQVWLLWEHPAGTWRALRLSAPDSRANARFDAIMRSAVIE